MHPLTPFCRRTSRPALAARPGSSWTRYQRRCGAALLSGCAVSARQIALACCTLMHTAVPARRVFRCPHAHVQRLCCFLTGWSTCSGTETCCAYLFKMAPRYIGTQQAAAFTAVPAPAAPVSSRCRRCSRLCPAVAARAARVSPLCTPGGQRKLLPRTPRGSGYQFHSLLPPHSFPCLQVLLIEPLQPGSASGGFTVTVQRTGAAAPELLYARKVVLATGIQGGGEWWVARDGLHWGSCVSHCMHSPALFCRPAAHIPRRAHHQLLWARKSVPPQARPRLHSGVGATLAVRAHFRGHQLCGTEGQASGHLGRSVQDGACRLAFAGTDESVHFTWNLPLLLLSTLALLPLLLVAAATFQDVLDCIAALVACRSNRCSCRGRPQAAPLHSTMHNMR